MRIRLACPRRLRGPAAALALGMLGSVAVAVPAHADRYCESPHCYSDAAYDGSGLEGMWSSIRQNSLTIGTNYGDPFAHINSETWLYLPSGAWLEAGLRHGDDTGASSGGCGCVAYDAFWSDGGTNHVEHEHIIMHTSANGNVDTFEFDHQTGAIWNFYFNGAYNNYSSITGASSGYAEAAGGEYQNTTCVAGAGLASNFDIYTNLEDGSGNWAGPAWNTANHIDPGCGFEGIHYSNGEYSWQKHAP